MPEEPATAGRWKRLAVSVGVGAAAATAAAAIGLSTALWVTRPRTDVMAHPVTEMGAIAMLTGAGALLVAVFRLVRRERLRSPAVALLGASISLLAAWGVWRVIGTYRARESLPFVDSTGAVVLAVAAMLCAVAAAILTVATARVAGRVGRGPALGVFLVVVVTVSVLTYGSVRDHRRAVWTPDLTASASESPPVPDRIGPVRYEVPIDDGEHRPEVYGVGHGFVVDARSGITAYDGRTGEKRWHADGFGTSGRFLVVRRDGDDTTGIVVVFLYHAIVAFDGGTGEVLWRRQYSSGGKVTAATGSVDALGMAVFTADAPEVNNSRTRLHSLDPATGRERWNQSIDCSNPTLSPGVPGQFSSACGKPSLIDAHTGHITDVPGTYAPDAGTDVYVSSFTRWDDNGSSTDITMVIDRDGRVIDEFTDATTVSEPHDGFVLVHDGSGWSMRDYRAHRSTPVHLPGVPAPATYDRPLTAWLGDRLLIAADGRKSPIFLVDPSRPGDKPAATPAPCRGDERLRDLVAVAGAVVAQCGDRGVVGLVP